MTTLIRIAVAALITLFLSSCGLDINIGDFGTGKKGNGKVVNETRKITDDFTEVSASEGLMVYVTQANDFKIEVEADENIINLITTEIKNGKLRIHARENIGSATKKIYVMLPEVTVLKSSSGAQLQGEDTIKGDHLEIDGSSGAQLRLDITVKSVKIDASSGADLTVAGVTDNADVDASSGANINAKELRTKDCSAEASSGGNVQVNASKTLTADASSGGNIGYSGEPSLQEKKSVSGSVHRY